MKIVNRSVGVLSRVTGTMALFDALDFCIGITTNHVKQLLSFLYICLHLKIQRYVKDVIATLCHLHT